MISNINYPLALIEPSFMQLLVILVVALLIFGKRLPDVAKSLGKSFGEFKKGLNEGNQELHSITSTKIEEKTEEQNHTS